jgi:hypothetical protein
MLGNSAWAACFLLFFSTACAPSRPPSQEEKDSEKPPARTGIEVVREFTCVPPSTNDDDILFALEGRSTESVAIRPEGNDCQFALILKRPFGDVTLTGQPGGYLLGTSDGQAGRGALCVSNIVHGLDTAGSNVSPSSTAHRIQRVDLECSVELAPNQWSRLFTVVQGGSDFAAWPSWVAFDESKSQWVAGWVRDFSFQFLNISDRGRPETDGVYETAFTITQDQLVLGATRKVADQVASESSVTMGGTP